MKPVLQALLVADHAYVDKATGKKVVAGIFHNLWFKKQVAEQVEEDGKIRLPIAPAGYRAGSPFCYVSLTDVRGSQDFLLRYRDLSADRSIFELALRVDSNDPLATHDVVLPLPSLPNTQPGVFALELNWNEETIGACRILVREMIDEENPDGS